MYRSLVGRTAVSQIRGGLFAGLQLEHTPRSAGIYIYKSLCPYPHIRALTYDILTPHSALQDRSKQPSRRPEVRWFSGHHSLLFGKCHMWQRKSFAMVPGGMVRSTLVNSAQSEPASEHAPIRYVYQDADRVLRDQRASEAASLLASRRARGYRHDPPQPVQQHGGIRPWPKHISAISPALRSAATPAH
jgi:hypothetical protein